MRSNFNHTRIEGVDPNMEISLKEYGFAWIEGETHTLFYYGVSKEEDEWTEFGYDILENTTDVRVEFNWAEFEEILQFVGEDNTWFDAPLQYKIEDLLAYYGYENVFGTASSERLTYDEIWSQ